MSSYYSQYATRAVRDYIRELIDLHGYRYFEDLSKSDKKKFVGLMIDAEPSYEFFSCIADTKDSEKALNEFVKALKTGCTFSDFVNICIDNAIDFYQDRMQFLFDDEKSMYVNDFRFNNYDEDQESHRIAL